MQLSSTRETGRFPAFWMLPTISTTAAPAKFSVAFISTPLSLRFCTYALASALAWSGGATGSEARLLAYQIMPASTGNRQTTTITRTLTGLDLAGLLATDGHLR